MLWDNALNVGLVGGVMVGNGRADVFFGLITIHGLLELTCIFIAAGVGLRVGWAWIAPGPLRTRGQALAETGRSGMVVALGLAVPLFVSGLVEAFVTPAAGARSRSSSPSGRWSGSAFLAYVVVFGARAASAGSPPTSRPTSARPPPPRSASRHDSRCRARQTAPSRQLIGDDCGAVRAGRRP